MISYRRDIVDWSAMVKQLFSAVDMVALNGKMQRREAIAGLGIKRGTLLQEAPHHFTPSINHSTVQWRNSILDRQQITNILIIIITNFIWGCSSSVFA